MVKNIFIKIGIVALVVIALGAGIIKTSELLSNPNTYDKSTIDKENRLHSLQGPKIVFVGGSNLVFGINSKRISDSLNKPVVNMGLFASLGLDFILNEAIDGIKENDIVLISSEYYMPLEANRKIFISLTECNKRARAYTFNSYKDRLINYVFKSQQSVNTIVFSLFSNKIDPIHRRDGFSVEGDLTTQLGKKNEKFSHNYGIAENDYTAEIKRINQFVNEVKQKKATVYYIYPCLSNTAYKLNTSSIQHFESKLSKELDCKALGKPSDFVYADSFFYNTVYHLNTVGREIRTNQIIEILK